MSRPLPAIPGTSRSRDRRACLVRPFASGASGDFIRSQRARAPRARTRRSPRDPAGVARAGQAVCRGGRRGAPMPLRPWRRVKASFAWRRRPRVAASKRLLERAQGDFMRRARTRLAVDRPIGFLHDLLDLGRGAPGDENMMAFARIAGDKRRRLIPVRRRRRRH